MNPRQGTETYMRPATFLRATIGSNNPMNPRQGTETVSLRVSPDRREQVQRYSGNNPMNPRQGTETFEILR